MNATNALQDSETFRCKNIYFRRLLYAYRRP
jgi:hypothetical protein